MSKIVILNFKECGCTEVATVDAPLLKVGESTVEVTWNVSKPNCDKDNAQHGPQDPGNLPYGTKTKENNYQLEDMDLT